MRALRTPLSLVEGVSLSVLSLTAGGLAVVGASALAPFIKTSLGLTQIGVGAIASFSYFGSLISSQVGGRCTDRFGPVPALLVGLVVMAAGLGIVVAAPTAAAFFAGVLVTGIGYGVVNPATSVLANPARARRRGLVMSVKQAGVPVGGILGGACLPAVATHGGWRVALVVPLVFCGAVMVTVAVRGRSRAPAEPGREQAGVPSHQRLRLPIGFLYGLGMAGAQVSIFAFTAVYLVESRGASGGVAGLGVALVLSGGAVGRPVWGWFSDLHPGRRPAVLVGAAVSSAVAITLMWAAPTFLLPVALLLVGLCAVGWNGVYVAAVAEAGHVDRVGGTTGSSLAMINIGAMVCPLLTGLALQTTGNWAVAWSACAVIVLSAATVAATGRVRRGEGLLA